ncbi:hypothetical protein HU200_032637 [Digitaria exilis]|uniref:Uncharacterized protein n=1 Tax=Digitaria exilis TaxID=1010633 RepID=A0A835BJQ4_9POAL|nr:hypothetical protein HU200_032637 [Digitaria exilis]
MLLLTMLLLLASELAAFGCCGHRIPRADVAAWRQSHGRVTPASSSATTTTMAAQAARATAPVAARDAEAALGESKRLVPQGSNPLHN